MLTFFDYLPSQNAYKVRLLLNHLQIPHETKMVSIFEGEGKTAEYRKINPTGAVPAILLEDGRALAESNAILEYLAEGTRYLPGDAFGRAKVNQWMSFEQDYVQNTIGSLRYWMMTSKVSRRPKELVDAKRAIGANALRILEAQLSGATVHLRRSVHHRRHVVVRVREPRRRGGIFARCLCLLSSLDRARGIPRRVPRPCPSLRGRPALRQRACVK